MVPLRWRWQLHLVAEEDDRLGGARGTRELSKRQLPCLVDEKHIELSFQCFAGKCPCRATNEQLSPVEALSFERACTA